MSLPLIQRTLVTFSDVGEKVIEFHYEYLPEYYFACGVIGHPTRQCVKNHEEKNGKLTSDALNRFTTAYLGLEGEINLPGRPIS